MTTKTTMPTFIIQMEYVHSLLVLFMFAVCVRVCSLEVEQEEREKNNAKNETNTTAQQ